MDVVVVGAGLAGLTAASMLAEAGRTVQVVESRSRVGGRLMTVAAGSSTGAVVDLGATWCWAGQPRIAALSAGLGLSTFPQFVGGRALHEDPGPDGPSVAEVDVDQGDLGPALRFGQGAQALPQRLAEHLEAGSLSLGTDVTAVARDGRGLSVTVSPAGGGPADSAPTIMTTSSVVVALPPRLALERIRFHPALPGELAQVMRATPTWMAEAVKCVAVYESAFWRAAGRSGSAFSHVGPLAEVHDGSSADGSTAALWGLVSDHSAARSMEPAERAPLVLEQLERLFGPAAGDPVSYFERDWSADPNTHETATPPPDPPLPYGHTAFGRPLMDGRLVWAGSETIETGGGHMEGAVRSGERAAALLLT